MNNKHTQEKLVAYANIWVRRKIFDGIGDEIKGHKHHYDHLSILSSGKVRVDIINPITKELVQKEYEAPATIIVRKDYFHNVTALSDDVTWYCIFAHRDIDGNVYTSEDDPLGTEANDMDLTKITIEE